MEWKEIEGTNGEYLVSSTGAVMTAKTGRIFKLLIDHRGYERVCLFKMETSGTTPCGILNGPQMRRI